MNYSIQYTTIGSSDILLEGLSFFELFNIMEATMNNEYINQDSITITTHKS